MTPFLTILDQVKHALSLARNTHTRHYSLIECDDPWQGLHDHFSIFADVFDGEISAEPAALCQLQLPVSHLRGRTTAKAKATATAGRPGVLLDLHQSIA